VFVHKYLQEQETAFKMSVCYGRPKSGTICDFLKSLSNVNVWRMWTVMIITSRCYNAYRIIFYVSWFIWVMLTCRLKSVLEFCSADNPPRQNCKIPFQNFPRLKQMKNALGNCVATESASLVW